MSCAYDVNSLPQGEQRSFPPSAFSSFPTQSKAFAWCYMGPIPPAPAFPCAFPVPSPAASDDSCWEREEVMETQLGCTGPTVTPRPGALGRPSSLRFAPFWFVKCILKQWWPLCCLQHRSWMCAWMCMQQQGPFCRGHRMPWGHFALSPAPCTPAPRAASLVPAPSSG